MLLNALQAELNSFLAKCRLNRDAAGLPYFSRSMNSPNGYFKYVSSSGQDVLYVTPSYNAPVPVETGKYEIELTPCFYLDVMFAPGGGTRLIADVEAKLGLYTWPDKAITNQDFPNFNYYDVTQYSVNTNFYNSPFYTPTDPTAQWPKCGPVYYHLSGISSWQSMPDDFFHDWQNYPIENGYNYRLLQDWLRNQNVKYFSRPPETANYFAEDVYRHQLSAEGYDSRRYFVNMSKGEHDAYYTNTNVQGIRDRIIQETLDGKLSQRTGVFIGDYNDNLGNTWLNLYVSPNTGRHVVTEKRVSLDAHRFVGLYVDMPIPAPRPLPSEPYVDTNLYALMEVGCFFHIYALLGYRSVQTGFMALPSPIFCSDGFYSSVSGQWLTWKNWANGYNNQETGYSSARVFKSRLLPSGVPDEMEAMRQQIARMAFAKGAKTVTITYP